MLNEKADIEEVYSENLLKFNGTIKNLVENSDKFAFYTYFF